MSVVCGELDDFAALPGQGVESAELAVGTQRYLVVEAKLRQRFRKESLARCKNTCVDLEGSARFVVYLPHMHTLSESS
jgi:hypothetical protein